MGDVNSWMFERAQAILNEEYNIESYSFLLLGFFCWSWMQTIIMWNVCTTRAIRKLYVSSILTRSKLFFGMASLRSKICSKVKRQRSHASDARSRIEWKGTYSYSYVLNMWKCVSFCCIYMYMNENTCWQTDCRCKVHKWTAFPLCLLASKLFAVWICECADNSAPAGPIAIQFWLKMLHSVAGRGTMMAICMESSALR